VTGHDEAQELERQILVRALGELGVGAGGLNPANAVARRPPRGSATRC
jgi:hypothetical protein